MTGHQEAVSRKHDADGKKRNKSTKRRGLGEIVDRGTEGVERLHRAVASLPLDALERIGRLEKPVSRVRKLQERSISATYELLRGVNKEVTQLVRDTSNRRRRQVQRGTARRVERAKPKKVVHSEKAATAS